MRKMVGSITLVLISSFWLIGVSHGQEKAQDKLLVLGNRTRAFERYELLGFPWWSPIILEKTNGGLNISRSPFAETKSTLSLMQRNLQSPLGVGSGHTCGSGAEFRWRELRGHPRLYGSELYGDLHCDQHRSGQVNEQENRVREMGIGEQLLDAYIGGVLGGILGMFISARVTKFVKKHIEPGLEAAGWAGITLKVGGTIGVPLGSATFLHIKGDKGYGRTLLGAAVPALSLATLDVIVTKGNALSPPYILGIGWTLAPVGAVIGYNLY